MTKRKLEAVAEAIVKTSGYWNADSEVYEARNPGGLLGFSPTHKKTASGFRQFASMIDGFQALLYDVELKMAGKSRAKLKPESTLEDFAVACGFQKPAAVNWAAFLRKALRDDKISHKTAI